MKISFSNVQVLAARFLSSCLQFGHLILFLVIVSFLSFGCGKTVNRKKNMNAFSRDINFLLMESQCNENSPGESKISRDIKNLFVSSRENSPGSFLFINPRFYNFENPMILSLEVMEDKYRKLKNHQNPEDLFYLFNGSRRFEEQKCSFKQLSHRKKYDIRPYLNFAHHCFKKYQSETCDHSEFQDMPEELESWTRINAIDLCKSFSKDVSCQAEFKINQNKKTLGSMINTYYARFQEERFEALFKIRSNHEKYECRKIPDDKDDLTVMVIKVLDSSIDTPILRELLNYVEATWSRRNFSLKLELVKNYSENVVAIIPTSKGISYVPDNNNRLVYLSSMNDLATMKRILAHEFGHVLGFPDCYIEFFDDLKKELVYYEISQKNTNIMCSLKADVQVPDDYFTQLTQNSCIFN